MNTRPIIEFNQFDLLSWFEDAKASTTVEPLVSVLQRLRALPMDDRFDDTAKERITGLVDTLCKRVEQDRFKPVCHQDLGDMYAELLDVQTTLLDHFNPTVGDVCAMVDALKGLLSIDGRSAEIKVNQLVPSQRLLSTMWRITKRPGPAPLIVTNYDHETQEQPTVTIQELRELPSNGSERVLVVGACLMGESICRHVSDRILQAHNDARRLGVSIEWTLNLSQNFLPKPTYGLSTKSKARLRLIVDLGCGFKAWFQSTVPTFFLPGSVAVCSLN